MITEKNADSFERETLVDTPVYQPWRTSDKTLEVVASPQLEPNVTWQQLLSDSRSRIDELSRLRRQTGHNIRTGAKFLRSLNQRQHDVSQLVSKITKLEQQVADRIEYFTTEVAEAQGNVTDLTDCLEDTQAVQQRTREELTELTNQVTDLADAQHIAETHVHWLREAQAETTRQVGHHDQRISDVVQEADQLRQANQSLREQMEQVTNANEQVVKQVERAQRRVFEMNDRQSAAADQVKQIDARVTEQVKQVDQKVTEQVDQVRKHSAKANHELAARTAHEIQQLDARTTEQVKQVDQKITEQMDRVRKHSAKANHELAARTAHEIQQLDARLAEAAAQAIHNAKQHGELAERLAKTDRRAKENTAHAIAINERLDHVDSGVSDLAQQIAQQDHRLDQTTATMRDELTTQVSEANRAMRKQMVKAHVNVYDKVTTGQTEVNQQIAEHRNATTDELKNMRGQLEQIASFTAGLETKVNELATQAEQQDERFGVHVQQMQRRHDQAETKLAHLNSAATELRSVANELCERGNDHESRLQKQASEGAQRHEHVAGRVGRLREDVHGIDNRTNALHGHFEQASQGLEKLTNEIADSHRATRRLRDRIEELAIETAQAHTQDSDERMALSVRLDSLQQGLAQIASHFDALEIPDIKPLAHRLIEIENRPEPAIPDVSGIKGQVDQLARTMEAMIHRTGQFKMRIESLEQTSQQAPAVAAAAISERITNLHAAVQAMQGRLEDHVEQMTQQDDAESEEMRQYVTQLQSELRAVEGRLMQQVEQASAKDDSSDAVNAMSERLAELQAELRHVEGRLDETPINQSIPAEQPAPETSNKPAGQDDRRGYHRDRIEDNKAVPFSKLIDELRDAE